MPPVLLRPCSHGHGSSQTLGPNLVPYTQMRAPHMRLDPTEAYSNIEDRRRRGDISIPGGGNLSTPIGLPDGRREAGGRMVACWDSATHRLVPLPFCEGARR